MTLPAYWLWLLIRQAYGVYDHTGYQVDTTPPFNELWVVIMMNKIMGGALRHWDPTNSRRHIHLRHSDACTLFELSQPVCAMHFWIVSHLVNLSTITDLAILCLVTWPGRFFSKPCGICCTLFLSFAKKIAILVLACHMYQGFCATVSAMWWPFESVVLIHVCACAQFPFDPMQCLGISPRFHDLHHRYRRGNYAATFEFIDTFFGTRTEDLVKIRSTQEEKKR